MIDVIVFSKDEETRINLGKAFTSENFWVKQIENNSQFSAVNINNFDLIIAHISSEQEWYDFKLNKLDSIPVLILSHSPIDFFYTENYPANLLDILILPIPGEELFARIKSIIHGLDYYQIKHPVPTHSGSLEEFPLLEILQNFMHRNYSGKLELDFSGIKANIKFHEGIIDSAYCERDYHGLPALEVMTFFNSGTFKFTVEEVKPVQEINYDMQKVLFNLLEKESQIENLLPYLPDFNRPLAQKDKAAESNSNYLDFFQHFTDGLTVHNLVINPAFEDKIELLTTVKELWQNGTLLYEEDKNRKQNKTAKTGSLFRNLFRKKSEPEEYEEEFPEENENEETPVKLKINITAGDIEKIRSFLS